MKCIQLFFKTIRDCLRNVNRFDTIILQTANKRLVKIIKHRGLNVYEVHTRKNRFSKWNYPFDFSDSWAIDLENAKSIYDSIH